jgi:hypothetical protein
MKIDLAERKHGWEICKLRSSRTFVVGYFLRSLVDGQASETFLTLTATRNFARRNRLRIVEGWLQGKYL